MCCFSVEDFRDKAIKYKEFVDKNGRKPSFKYKNPDENKLVSWANTASKDIKKGDMKAKIKAEIIEEICPCILENRRDKSFDDIWNERFEQLIELLNTKGYPSWTSDNKEERSLNSWISFQRARFSKGELEDWKIKKLNDAWPGILTESRISKQVKRVIVNNAIETKSIDNNLKSFELSDENLAKLVDCGIHNLEELNNFIKEALEDYENNIESEKAKNLFKFIKPKGHIAYSVFIDRKTELLLMKQYDKSADIGSMEVLSCILMEPVFKIIYSGYKHYKINLNNICARVMASINEIEDDAVRESLILVYYGRLNMREASEIIGVSHETVRTYINKGLKYLRLNKTRREMILNGEITEREVKLVVCKPEENETELKEIGVSNRTIHVLIRNYGIRTAGELVQWFNKHNPEDIEEARGAGVTVVTEMIDIKNRLKTVVPMKHEIIETRIQMDYESKAENFKNELTRIMNKKAV